MQFTFLFLARTLVLLIILLAEQREIRRAVVHRVCSRTSIPLHAPLRFLIYYSRRSKFQLVPCYYRRRGIISEGRRESRSPPPLPRISFPRLRIFRARRVRSYAFNVETSRPAFRRPAGRRGGEKKLRGEYNARGRALECALKLQDPLTDL